MCDVIGITVLAFAVMYVCFASGCSAIGQSCQNRKKFKEEKRKSKTIEEKSPKSQIEEEVS